MSELSTCERCGFNVAPSGLSFTPSAQQVCKPCHAHTSVLEQTDRARTSFEEADRGPNLGGAIAAGVRAMEREKAETDLANLEQDPRSAVEAAQVAGAQTFTCLPCGQTLSVFKGLKNADGRVLCEPCFKPDAEARELAAEKLAKSEKLKKSAGFVASAIFVLVCLALMIANR